MEYRREIDGLRALAVIPVILFHAGFQTFSGGFVGVDVFFVISGYLITSLILAEQQAGTFTVIHFYERRARRILPALFVVLLACSLFAWFWLLPGDMKEFSESVIAVAAFASNILFWRTSGYFDTANEFKPLLHTWSLAVEEQYYLFFPILLLLAWRWGTRRMVAMLAVGAVASLWMADWGALHKPEAAFYLLPTRGWELLLGALAAFGFPSLDESAFWRAMDQPASGAGLLLIAYAVFAFDSQTPFPGMHALVPTLGAALLILFATPRTPVGRLLQSRLLVGIGLISYSAYLWHQPLFAFARYGSPGEPGKPLLAALAAAALTLAYLSWRYVEVPFRDRRRFTRGQVFGGAAMGSALFISLGIAGSLTDGFSYRYGRNDRYLAELQFREAGRYVQKRFDDLALKTFDAADQRLKVLIVGDSYAQDLVNALYEADLDRHLQVATRYIGADCGNLFLERARFAAYIDRGSQRGCEGTELYDDQTLRRFMLDADEVWFASSWKYWQAVLIPQSVTNVQRLTGKEVRVFGRKNFGRFTIKDLLAKRAEERYAMKVVVTEDTIRTNALLRQSLQPNVFVDVQRLLCGDDLRVCPLFTAEGALISYDGGHLTKPGAQYYGSRLAQDALLRRLLHAES